MDIEYLILLQNARTSLPNFFELFFAGCSYLADGPVLLAIALMLYWCVDKRLGLTSVLCVGFAMFIGQFVKIIACVYRPWILDSRITPSEHALHGATGYSFPSGHTMGSTALFGNFAWFFKDKNRVICIACIVFALLAGFSRNFLGVHTPQDVIVGMLIGIASIILVNVFLAGMDRMDAEQPGHNKDLIALVAVVAACATMMAVGLLKPYPMDYVNEALLVDPLEMQKDFFASVGGFLGLSIGWYLERHYVQFETGPQITMKNRVIRFAVGLVLLGVTYLTLNYGLKLVLPVTWAKFIAFSVAAFMAMFVAPLVFSHMERK